MSEIIKIRCGFCNHEFDEDYILATCVYGTSNAECPHCVTQRESQKPTNLIDSFIADGGFDQVMGCKNESR